MSPNQESAAKQEQPTITEPEKPITLKSSDGELFTLPISEAKISVTIKNMIDEDCASEVIPLANLKAKTLAKVVTFMKKSAVENLSETDKAKIANGFFHGMNLDDMFDVILAANYLEIKDLLDEAAQKIADTIKHKDVKYVRRAFNVVNDFEPEEEAEMRRQYPWAWEGNEIERDD